MSPLKYTIYHNKISVKGTTVKRVWVQPLLVRRAPTALEGGPSERQHLLGVGCENSEWERRTTKGVLPEFIEIRASL